MNKTIATVAKVLVGVGALNWATARLLNFDVLSFVPAGMISTIVIAAIGLSGAWVLVEVYKKRI